MAPASPHRRRSRSCPGSTRSRSPPAICCWRLAASLLGQGSWRTRLWTYRLPVALIHAGLVVALIAGTAATVFDSYAQRMVAYPEDFGGAIRFPDGFELSVRLEQDGAKADGARGQGFRSIGQVAWQLEREGEIIEPQTATRLSRRASAARRRVRPGPADVRDPGLSLCTLCQRFEPDDPPVHSRGAWRDVQVWLPAVEYEQASDGARPRAARPPCPWSSRSIR